jgi:hypothetical protein
MVLMGTQNDKARAAKVTLKTREERNKALAADDSVLEGKALRARTWACRPKEKPKEREFKRATQGNSAQELRIVSPPPGLEQSDEEEEETEGNQQEGNILTVAQGPRKPKEMKQSKTPDEKEREEERGVGEERRAEEKAEEGNQGRAHPEEKDEGDTKNTEAIKEGRMSERKGSETSQAGKGKRETRRGVEVGAKEEAEEDEEDGGQGEAHTGEQNTRRTTNAEEVNERGRQTQE